MTQRTKKVRKPLEGVRRKLLKAVREAKARGIPIIHSWGDIVKNYDYGSPAYERVGEYKGETCPMGAAILVYDDVDGLQLLDAGAKIFDTNITNILAFINGYDGDGFVGEYEGSARHWYKLGVEFRKHADINGHYKNA